MTVEEMRTQFAENDAKRDMGLTTPDEIERFDDIRYSDSGRWGLLDVYRRKDAPPFQSVLVNVHGGGYVYATKETYQYYCMGMAMRGFTVVSYNYRLAPEDTYHAALMDTGRAMEWLCANYRRFGFDLNNVFMTGDSAGADLLSQYALAWSSERYRGLLGLNVPAFRLGAVLLNCGFYCISSGFRPDSEAVAAYYGHEPQRTWGDALRLDNYIDSYYPPAFVMTCEDDFLRDRAEPMAELLRSRDVPVRYKLYSGSEGRRLGHVFHIDQRSPEAAACNDEQAAFLKEHIM